MYIHPPIHSHMQVDASDFPFRLMCIKAGATATYTQMYLPEKLFADEEYRERALRDLQYERALPKQWRRPVIVQLGGRDMARMVEAAQLFAPHCDGIGMQ
jgi:tRNA-dihydrouridine synthase 1